MTDEDPLSAAKGCASAVLIGILLWAAVVSLGVAFAGPADDLKAPPPMPRQQKPCLRVKGIDRPHCFRVEPETLRLYGLKPGDVVSPKAAFEIDTENRNFLRTKLR
jgi:hypothetical protein